MTIAILINSITFKSLKHDFGRPIMKTLMDTKKSFNLNQFFCFKILETENSLKLPREL